MKEVEVRDPLPLKTVPAPAKLVRKRRIVATKLALNPNTAADELWTLIDGLQDEDWVVESADLVQHGDGHFYGIAFLSKSS